MSLRTLLGLEGSHLTDEQIMSRISGRTGDKSVEFLCDDGTVRVNIPTVSELNVEVYSYVGRRVA